MIKTADQLYELVYRIISGCRECGYDDIAIRLEDAMDLGSSGLEIIGEIRNILIGERSRLLSIVTKRELKKAIKFVDKAFGR